MDPPGVRNEPIRGETTKVVRATGARGIVWAPPLLVGTALGISATTGAAILLYGSPGLGRAAAVVGAVSLLSLGAGLLAGGIGRIEAGSAPAARWWTALLATLLCGAVFAGLWEATSGLGAGFLGQGLGLALTHALPAYCAGGVWARMGGLAGSRGPRATSAILIGAALGAAVGALLVLALLGRPVRAVTALLAATVLASAGARCQGWVLDRMGSGYEPTAGGAPEEQTRSEAFE